MVAQNSWGEIHMNRLSFMHFLTPGFCTVKFLSCGLLLHHCTSDKVIEGLLVLSQMKDMIRILVLKLIWTIGSLVFVHVCRSLTFCGWSGSHMHMYIIPYSPVDQVRIIPYSPVGQVRRHFVPCCKLLLLLHLSK